MYYEEPYVIYQVMFMFRHVDICDVNAYQFY